MLSTSVSSPVIKIVAPPLPLVFSCFVLAERPPWKWLWLRRAKQIPSIKCLSLRNKVNRPTGLFPGYKNGGILPCYRSQPVTLLIYKAVGSLCYCSYRLFLWGMGAVEESFRTSNTSDPSSRSVDDLFIAGLTDF